MKEKVNIKLDKIAFIIICSIAFLLNIYIGSSLKEPLYIMQTVITIFTSIYIITKKILGEKNIILKSKIDILVMLFMISTILPLIFKTYSSVNDTYQFILKYFSVYSMYILCRNILNKRRLTILINIIIFSSIFVIIFGIDKITYNIFSEFLNKINAVDAENDRLISTFGYPNTLAIYLSIILFFSIAQYKNTNKKYLKVIYIVYMLSNIVCIVLTQSKSTIAMLLGVTAVYIFIEGKKRKNLLKLILIGIIGLIIFGTYFIIAINIPKDLEITEELKTCVVKGLEPGKEYDLTFEIDAESEKNYKTFEIEVVEINRYLHDTILERIQFSSFSGEKNIHIETSSLHAHLEIKIKNKLNEKLTISNFWINNEPYVLEYKYIKDALVRMIKDFNFKYQSVWQRGDYYKDGFKIIKENWLVGAGGNAWGNLYRQNQEYNYVAKEAHSYPLDVWMSFGLLGILSYIGIVISILCKLKYYKTEDNINKAIIVGLLFMIIHSIIDLDFSFFIMLNLLFIMLATIYENNKSFENKIRLLNILEYIIIICIIIVSFENLKTTCVKYFVKDSTYKTQVELCKTDREYLYNRIMWLLKNSNDNQEKINYARRYINQEPYSLQNEMYEILLNEIVNDVNYYNIEEKICELEEIEQILKERKRSSKYDISEIRQRANLIVQSVRELNIKSNFFKNESLKEIGKRFSQIVIDEYSDGIEIIKQYEKTGEYKFVTEMQLKSYKLIYEDAVKNIEEK